MSSRDGDKGWNWPITGVVLSIGYGIVLLVAIRLEHSLAITTPQHWLALDLNELGDFLAGAFAPLAFLWLFVAVMIQSQELALQRKEMRETRTVLTSQAEESKRQAEHIATQTTILEKQLARSIMLEADSQFERKVSGLSNFVKYQIEHKGPLATLVIFDISNDAEVAIESLCNHFIQWDRSYQDHGEEVETALEAFGRPEIYDELMQRMTGINDILPTTSPSRQDFLDAIHFPEALLSVEKFCLRMTEMARTRSSD